MVRADARARISGGLADALADLNRAIALMAGKPEAAQMVAAECVVLAETKDHMNWQLIGAASQSAAGTVKELLKTAYEEVEDEEDERHREGEGPERSQTILLENPITNGQRLLHRPEKVGV